MFTRFISALGIVRRKAALATLLAVLIGANPSAEELNSERIERRFGSYRVDVLQQDDGLRIASLASTEAGIPTFAKVEGGGETVVITRHGKPIGALVPMTVIRCQKFSKQGMQCLRTAGHDGKCLPELDVS